MTGSSMQSNKRFDVALSFPGERRVFVEQVAETLAQSLPQERVFYDKWYTAELARPNLDTHLQNIYRNDTKLIVVFLSTEYNEKEWCGLEWRAVRDLMKQKKDHAVMPIRLDEGDVHGFFAIDGYIDASNRQPEEIAGFIIQRLSVQSVTLNQIPAKGLSDQKRRSLEHDLGDLRKAIEKKEDLLSKLRGQRAVETNLAEQQKLDHQIVNTEKDCDDLTNEIRGIEQQLKFSELRQWPLPAIEQQPDALKGDYARLETLLKAGRWKEADQETVAQMCRVMGREKEGWLRDEDIVQFPCADLRKMDQLWKDNSKGKFGFSVQKKIWRECGSPTKYNPNWEEFGDRVGWRIGRKEWLQYKNLTFNTTAPKGHFPSATVPSVTSPKLLCSLWKQKLR